MLNVSIFGLQVRFASLSGHVPVDSALEIPKGGLHATPVPAPEDSSEGAVFAGTEEDKEVGFQSNELRSCPWIMRCR